MNPGGLKYNKGMQRSQTGGGRSQEVEVRRQDLSDRSPVPLVVERIDARGGRSQVSAFRN
ncbi:hypothetical protein HC891_01515 [Candidatus Gracilibacteria bacterium]|nr:hypothetical protein [Candidatus Gracilibacteria bacterium]